MPLVSSREVTSPCINAHSRNNQRRPQSLCFKRIVSYCFSSFSYWVSGFWDVDCLATHRATVQYPYQTHRMPFPPGTASPNTEWHLVQYPAVPGPYRHQERLRAYGGGYRRALKVLGFARLVLGQSLHGDVEAGEACEAAEAKKVRRRWSTGVRRPIANAAAAGATPKDTCKAKSVLSIVLDDGC